MGGEDLELDHINAACSDIERLPNNLALALILAANNNNMTGSTWLG